MSEHEHPQQASMRQALHVVFTMNCEPPTKKGARDGPATWETSTRAIEGFCDRVLAGGYAATLFVSPRVAEELGPLLEELASRGVELGLLVHPKHLDVPRYTSHLGAYSEQDQHDLIEYATERFVEAVGIRPRSFRGGDFSANDTTFSVLYGLGFRQGSLSNPGRDIGRHNARWRGAEPDPHYVNIEDRLVPGTVGFLEVPVTSDAQQIGRGGFSPDLCVEIGTFGKWHHPLIDGQLARMATVEPRVRTLCVYTHNRFAYHLDDDQHSQTLVALMDYFDGLNADQEIVPITLAGLHERWYAAQTSAS